MANPNIVNVTSILGQTNACVLTTTANTILTNPASSGKILKVNTLMIANKDGTNAADANVIYTDATSTEYHLAATISIPADSTMVLIDKNSSIYLQENTSIKGSASASGDLDMVISYEEIS